jgi:hypothetical protein
VLLAMGDSSASDSSALSKHEVQHDDFRKLTAQALMVRARSSPAGCVCARAETFARTSDKRQVLAVAVFFGAAA